MARKAESSAPTEVSITTETLKRGRKPVPAPVAPDLDIDHEAVASAALASSAVQANVVALAEQLGYDGSLTVGALEDEIRFYQRRSVEALLAVGTRLLLLKEQTRHGEFTERIKLLGFSDRSARRFMQAAFKTAKSANLAVLSEQVSSGGKFLELVTLDDDDLEALKDGGTVAGLTLDDIDTMSASELKAALREARDNEAAMGRVLQEKNAKLDKLSADSSKKPAVTDLWDKQIIGVSDEINQIGLVGDECIGKQMSFVEVCEVLADKLDPDEDGYLDKLEQVRVPIARLNDQIERWAHVLARLRFEFETRLSGYLDNSHILPPADAE